MKNYKMKLQYLGSHYDGWQKQPSSKRTIQEKLEKAISTLLDEPIEILGSGRTDAGVHALGQTANFKTNTEISIPEFLYQINLSLPPDLAVCSIEEVPERFHCRLNATSKIYRYTIWNSAISNVFLAPYCFQVETPLALEQMKKAALLLCGEHDFKAFCSNKKMKKSTVRVINEIRFEVDGPKIDLYYEGNGFLYHMVRIMTGTLVEVGEGKRTAASIPQLFQSLNRADAGFTAPPQGLTLMEVKY